MEQVCNATIMGCDLETIYSREKMNAKMNRYTDFLDVYRHFGADVDEKIIRNYIPESLYLEEFSIRRGNIVKCLPLRAGERILEIGSDSGAVTKFILEKECEVTCLSDSALMSYINAYRNHKKTFRIYVDSSLDIRCISAEQKFDYIIVWKIPNGNARKIQNMIEQWKTYLIPNGKIIVALSNLYGIRRWAGYRQELSQHMFENDQETYVTFNEVMQLREKNKADIYYPYPDYMYMLTLYSDVFQPKRGELYKNSVPFREGRFSLFNEAKAFDEVIRHGDFKQFSNSYLICIGGQ